MAKACEKCGGAIPPQSGRSRPRKYCATCRPSRERKVAPRPVVVAEIRPGAAREVLTLTEATRRKLADADLLDDPGALVLLQLARSIDDGGHSGASLASLSREFRAALDSAMASVGRADDGADEDGMEWGVG